MQTPSLLGKKRELISQQSVIAKADIPECEDLAFGSNVDAYRQFSAPAYMAGKEVVSAEVGAVLGRTYQMTIPHLLQLIHRLFAGGVNAVVLHGYPYSGEASPSLPVSLNVRLDNRLTICSIQTPHGPAMPLLPTPGPICSAATSRHGT